LSTCWLSRSGCVLRSRACGVPCGFFRVGPVFEVQIVRCSWQSVSPGPVILPTLARGLWNSEVGEVEPFLFSWDHVVLLLQIHRLRFFTPIALFALLPRSSGPNAVCSPAEGLGPNAFKFSKCTDPLLCHVRLGMRRQRVVEAWRMRHADERQS